MKGLVLASALVAAVSGGSFGAWAADLPTKKTPPAPAAATPTPFNWTGFYAGLNLGYSIPNGGDTTTAGSPIFASLAPAFVPNSLGTSNGGVIVGGQVGYNYQVGAAVFGVETDLDYVNQRNSASFTGAVTPLGTALATSATRDLDYLGTVRARIGFTPADALLLYATGGLAYGGVSTSGSVVATSAPALAWYGSTNETKVGWALGAGAEYALTRNISLRGEYLYYDLGKTNTIAPGNAAVASVAALNGVYYASQATTAGSLLRVGLNFKF